MHSQKHGGHVLTGTCAFRTDKHRDGAERFKAHLARVVCGMPNYVPVLWVQIQGPTFLLQRRGTGVLTAFSYAPPCEPPQFLVKTNGCLRAPTGPAKCGRPHHREVEALLVFVTCTNLSPSAVPLSSLGLLLTLVLLVLGGPHAPSSILWHHSLGYLTTCFQE